MHAAMETFADEQPSIVQLVRTAWRAASEGA